MRRISGLDVGANWIRVGCPRALATIVVVLAAIWVLQPNAAASSFVSCPRTFRLHAGLKGYDLSVRNITCSDGRELARASVTRSGRISWRAVHRRGWRHCGHHKDGAVAFYSCVRGRTTGFNEPFELFSFAIARAR